jgi:peptide/nickel transport system substrate-binding protein
MRRPILRARAVVLGGAVALAAVLMAACGSSSPTTSSSSTTTKPPTSSLQPGGLATWAEPPSTPPNYIFPINSCCFSVANLSDFQELMYRPLYWFGTGDQPTLNPDLSLAAEPTYNGNTVVVNLKSTYMWSNGEHVTAQDVVFFMNMLQVVKSVDWGAYAPGYFPDNVKSVTATGQYQVTFQLTGSFSSQWFTYNELSQITPLPIAWDITKTGGAPGSGGCSSASFASIKTTSSKSAPIIPEGPAATACFAVYNYLANSKTGQAATPATYATNPLWGIVDGPWKLKSLSVSTGNAVFVPNTAYTGPVKPALSEFEELGYTADTAEYAALRAGNSISVGYVPAQDIPPTTGNPLVAGANASPLVGRYSLNPVYFFQVNYFPMNFQNPTVGKIFSQLYVRQALQLMIDQETYIKTLDAGYGVPTAGPVPTTPATYASSLELSQPYAYNPTKAKSLLTSNGWTDENGVDTCTSGNCVSEGLSGKKLQWTLLYATGITTFTNQVNDMVNAWHSIGIDVTPKGETFSTIISTAAVNCFATGDCSWQMANWGGGWVFAPDYLPTGEEIFDGKPGCSSPSDLAVSNAGGYCDATNHANILATTQSSSNSVLYTYENYLAQQLPVLFQPLAASALTEIATGLYGVTPQNVFGTLTPENWEWAKGASARLAAS